MAKLAMEPMAQEFVWTWTSDQSGTHHGDEAPLSQTLQSESEQSMEVIDSGSNQDYDFKKSRRNRLSNISSGWKRYVELEYCYILVSQGFIPPNWRWQWNDKQRLCWWV